MCTSVFPFYSNDLRGIILQIRKCEHRKNIIMYVSCMLPKS